MKTAPSRTVVSRTATVMARAAVVMEPAVVCSSVMRSSVVKAC